MQENDVAEITLEHIPKDILIFIILFLNFKDMWNLSTTSTWWNKFFNGLLKNKYFDTQLAHKWIEKTKADITNKPPEFTDHNALQCKEFYIKNMVEKPELDTSILGTVGRNIQVFFSGAHFSDFREKIKSYSDSGFDVQLSRLLANNPELTTHVYGGLCDRRFVLAHIRHAIASGFNYVFDIHFAALKRSINYDISTIINEVDEHMLVSLFHYTVQKGNLYCVKVLLEQGGNPLVKTINSKKTGYTIALTLDNKLCDAIFDLLLDSTDRDKFKADLNDLSLEDFEKKYGISKSSMLKKSQDHQQPSKIQAIDDTFKGTEPFNLGLKK